jgi:hypothetical protein
VTSDASNASLLLLLLLRRRLLLRLLLLLRPRPLEQACLRTSYSRLVTKPAHLPIIRFVLQPMLLLC